jgi:hypothetical protein
VRGLRSAALGQERNEGAPSVVAEHDRLAVDERRVHGQSANRRGDPWESISEVRTAPAPNLDALALFAGEDAETVMLDFVQPAGPAGGRSASVGSHGRMKPTGGFRRQRGVGARQITFMAGT